MFYFRLFLFGLCVITSFVLPFHVNAEPSVVNPSDLLGKIYAVHATRTLPESDYLRAGLTFDNWTRVQKALFPQVRKTLHFALGELVRPVDGVMNWEDCPYALVTSMRNLLPQLININCYDTFILGDLKLGPDTFLILPDEFAEKIESQATIVTYSPQSKNLREAVDELILSLGGWHIEMDSDDIEDELHPAYLDDINVNTAEFFGPLKEERPWIAIGLRFNPCDGEHYRLSEIEQSLIIVAMQILSCSYQENGDLPNLESSYLENTMHTVSDHFEKWSQSLIGFEWCSESKQAYLQIAVELKKWTCLMHEELRIRKTYGKTLMSAPDDFFLECTSMLNQPKALQNFIDQNKEQLLNYPNSAKT